MPPETRCESCGRTIRGDARDFLTCTQDQRVLCWLCARRESPPGAFQCAPLVRADEDAEDEELRREATMVLVREMWGSC